MVEPLDDPREEERVDRLEQAEQRVFRLVGSQIDPHCLTTRDGDGASGEGGGHLLHRLGEHVSRLRRVEGGEEVGLRGREGERESNWEGGWR